MNAINHALAPGAPAEIDDGALAARVLAGDGAGFELMMRRHNRRLYRLARSMLRNAADAEDALQEAYLSAFRSIAGFRGQSSLATWLSRIVLNECLARQRRQGRRDTIVSIVSASGDGEQEDQAMPGPHSDSPDNALGRSQLRAQLERRLDELPEVFRTVFVLR
jgi:RNA polymerase sigma-70 factor (ECF subfamily)